MPKYIPAALLLAVTATVTVGAVGAKAGPPEPRVAFPKPPAPRPTKVKKMTALAYPASPTSDQKDTYHGTVVPDPFRPLEDANAGPTQAWVEAQNKVTFDYLAKLPGRDRIKARYAELYNYPKYSAPSKEGSRYFYNYNTGLQNQFVLYVAENLKDPGHILLDPNTLSKDGTVALSGMSVSEDGNYLAYGISDAGSDWQTWHVRDVATGKDTGDLLRWCKFTGAAWMKDGRGFYYSRYAEPKAGEELSQLSQNQKVYFHRLGESQDKDTLIYERPDHPDWYLGAGPTEDNKYLVLYASNGTDPKGRLYLKDLTKPDAPVRPWFENADATYSPLGNDGSTFYVLTNKGADRQKIVAISADETNPDVAKARVIVPETKDVIEGASLFGQELIVTYLRDARSVVVRYELTGKMLSEIALPGIGSVSGFGGKRDEKETFYTFTGYTTPPTVYRYDIMTGKSEVFRKSDVRFDPDRYTTEQVFYQSKDGTRIPMFLTYKKGIKRDGTNPTLLYGYGGFSISLTPGFSVGRVVWLEMGGIYAVPNLRGGSEYGEPWHEAGTKLRKQNVFDDFIGAAEYLVREKYTSPAKLAIQGGSNGGLLVGACMTQRPDLFGVALPAVGVMDMLRFQKFTVGWGWIPDYGDADKNADEFKALYAYSPLHCIKDGVRYPATLVTTSDHDDRVVPAHSYKFTARLQEAQTKAGPDAPPTLIRIEVRAGHGAGKPTDKIIEEATDIYAFTLYNLGVPVPEKLGE